MAEGAIGFLCRLIPHTQEYGIISNLLWDATLPFFVRGIMCWRWWTQALYIGAMMLFLGAYSWAYHQSAIDSLYFSMLYWAAIYIVVAAVLGVISGYIVRAIRIKRGRIALLLVHLGIWYCGYFAAIEWLQATKDTYVAYTC